jgi:hypothetical protein
MRGIVCTGAGSDGYRQRHAGARGREPHRGHAVAAARDRAQDEVLVSTRPPGGPKWLNPNPMGWLEELGVPVTTVTLGERMRRDRGVLKVRCRVLAVLALLGH